MTVNNSCEDKHKDFVTQFRAITLRVYNLATKFAKNSDSLSSEKELAIIWVEFGYKTNLKKVQVPTRS